MMEGPWCRFRREARARERHQHRAGGYSLKALDLDRPIREADIASKADIRTENSSFFLFRYSDLIGAFPTSSAAVFLPEGKSRPRSAVTGGAVRSRTVRSPSECRMMPLFAL